MKRHSLMLASLLGVALLVLSVPQRAAADDDDPPSRVARLSYTHGAVSFQPAGTDDWVSAVINRPMTTGDKLWSDNDSRAEMHIGSASLRIGGNTGFSFLNLTDNVTQIRLTDGTLRVRVKHLDENETFEIDTPNLAFSVLRSGVYRITVDQNNQTTIVRVRGGEGEVTAPGAAYNIHAREIGTFSGDDQLQADIQPFNGDDDDFDLWCADRDRHEDRSVSARYVSPDVIGYQDLDDYGSWRPVPEYGEVWFPQTTVVGWAPYRYGHWAYIYPWGYTWIDDAPWGFAPFHYGRWVSVRGYWGWVPCPPPAPAVVYVRPVYAPALVAWIGGPHVGVGIGVGWFPLGPREVFVPSYHVSRTYITNVNISNTTVNTTVVNNYYNTTVINHQVTNIRYVNQGVGGGVTVINRETFVSAQPVGRNIVHIDNREVARAEVNVNAPAIAPERRAFLGTGQQVAMKPPQQAWTRPVVAKITPPPPPVAYNRQVEAIKENGGRPIAIHQMQAIQPQQNVHADVRIATPARDADRGRFGQQQNNPNTGNGQGQPGFKGGYRTSGSNNGLQNGQSNHPAGPNNAGQYSNGQQQNNAGSGNVQGQPGFKGGYRTSGSNNSVQNPEGNQPAGTNNGGQIGNGNNSRKVYDDRPPSSRPNVAVDNSGNAGRDNHQNYGNQQNTGTVNKPADSGQFRPFNKPPDNNQDGGRKYDDRPSGNNAAVVNHGNQQNTGNQGSSDNGNKPGNSGQTTQYDRRSDNNQNNVRHYDDRPSGRGSDSMNNSANTNRDYHPSGGQPPVQNNASTGRTVDSGHTQQDRSGSSHNNNSQKQNQGQEKKDSKSSGSKDEHKEKGQ